MPLDEQLDLLFQGTEYGDPELERAMRRELRARLEESQRTGRPLRVYLGVDPRTSDLHLGHTVPMRKLRQFQDLGHTAIFLIGTFTSLVGDPGDKDKARALMSFEEVMANAKTYTEQAFKVLDPERTVIRYNHEWLGDLKFGDLIHIASHFTVQQFLARDNFRKRHEKGDPIHLHEFFYPLMQGYDAVALETDVQIGGTDQTFNIIVAGRKLQEAFGQRPQVGILLPLLPGTDGKTKMSKSLGNHIPLTATPEDMYGKIMSVPDEAMPLYMRLLTRWGPQEIQALEADLQAGRLHPRDLKMRIAREVVEIFHGPEAAARAEAHFVRVFQQRDLPEDLPEYTLKPGQTVLDVLVDAGLVSSRNEGRRMVNQRSVRLDGQVLTDALAPFPGPGVLRVGKRRFVRVVEA
ncbi:MAG: tyrosine--tRNA ligase [Chloroflexi bacterium]|nr:tyrosine--tRNA ligase [Chloroflexota bacterium]